MKITINIETQNPEDLMRVAQALSGVMAPAENPNATAAAKATRPTKAAEPGATATATSTPSPTSPAPTTPAAAPATSAPSPTPPATVAAETSADAAPVTQADLTAAANQAVATVGPGSAAKVQVYIREHFTQPDGTPGTLMKTAPAQWPALLADLQKIARKELAL